MRIVITGTPGTGKTTISKELSSRLGLKYINLNDIALSEGDAVWDESRNTFSITDPDKSSKALNKALSSSGECVCETLAIDLLDPGLVDRVVVLRRDPRKLWSELLGRGWPPRKAAENVLAEIVNVLSHSAWSAFGGKTIEINTTDKTIDECVSMVIDALSGRLIGNTIDWLAVLDGDELMDLIQLLERSANSN